MITKLEAVRENRRIERTIYWLKKIAEANDDIIQRHNQANFFGRKLKKDDSVIQKKTKDISAFKKQLKVINITSR